MRACSSTFLTATTTLFLTVCALPAGADELSLDAAKDNTLCQSMGNLSNGMSAAMFVGRTGQATGIDIRRGLIEFDVAGAIPAGSTIDAVTLRLWLTSTNSGPTLVDLYPVLAEWGEGSSIGGSGGGGCAQATAGDATWMYRYWSTDLWTNIGGDYGMVSSATVNVGGLGQFYEWTSAQMATDVQDWLDDPNGNHGWILIGDESLNMSAKRFSSREGTVPSQRPVLVVEFTPPSVSQAYCFGNNCPCNNDDPLAGCANGSFGLGSLLSSAGSASVSSDDLVLSASHSTPGQSGIFFQGDETFNGGNGLPFGDGLRCAGINAIRLESRVADGAGDVSSTVSISVGGNVSPGDLRRYQWWYRDPLLSPCGAAFNLTNGLELSWLP